MISDQVEVSIVMITYGHAESIRSAVESVLNQNVDFSVELIIANDKSPDDTSHIVEKIIDTHPRGNMINYFCHEINKGMMPNFVWALNEAKGKYIAICEGDDSWTDLNKLAIQYAFLEENEDCFIHTHNAKFVDLFSKSTRPFNEFLENGKFTTKDAVLKKWFTPTASFFFRNKIKFEAWDGVNGDLMVLLLCSLKGYIYYDKRIMSVYNYGSPNSQTVLSSRITLYKKKIKLMQRFNKASGYRYIHYTSLIIGKAICAMAYVKLKGA